MVWPRGYDTIKRVHMYNRDNSRPPGPAPAVYSGSLSRIKEAATLVAFSPTDHTTYQISLI